MFIPIREAAGYISDDFYAALEMFYTTETLACLPFAGGWAEQPEWITRALLVLKTESWKIDEEEYKLKQQEKEDAQKYVKRQ